MRYESQSAFCQTRLSVWYGFVPDLAWIWGPDYFWSSIKTADTNILSWRIFLKNWAQRVIFYWLDCLYPFFSFCIFGLVPIWPTVQWTVMEIWSSQHSVDIGRFDYRLLMWCDTEWNQMLCFIYIERSLSAIHWTILISFVIFSCWFVVFFFSPQNSKPI